MTSSIENLFTQTCVYISVLNVFKNRSGPVMAPHPTARDHCITIRSSHRLRSVFNQAIDSFSFPLLSPHFLFVLQQALMMTIVNLAQNFVGSNNVNILQPLGQFGTRINGGKDAASPRYIFTMLR